MSNFHPDTGGRRWSLLFRSLVQLCCGGGRGAADKCHWPVWVALTVFLPHWVCPHSWVCALPIYTAQAPGCSIWSRPCVASSSSFGLLHKSAGLVGPAFCTFPTRAAQAARSFRSALSPGAGSLLPSAAPASGGPCVCSGELASSRNPPGRCQPSRISESLWLETGSLFAVW